VSRRPSGSQADSGRGRYNGLSGMLGQRRGIGRATCRNRTRTGQNERIPRTVAVRWQRPAKWLRRSGASRPEVLSDEHRHRCSIKPAVDPGVIGSARVHAYTRRLIETVRNRENPSFIAYVDGGKTPTRARSCVARAEQIGKFVKVIRLAIFASDDDRDKPDPAYSDRSCVGTFNGGYFGIF